MKVTLQSYGVGSLDLEVLRKEFNSFYEEMRSFKEMEPIDILTHLSAYTARASQVRFNIVRNENKVIQKFRTTELDPFIGECDRQFKIWSRLLTAYQLEWETSKGQT